ncbi:MAG: ribonuclease HI [Caldicoprobacterales bacterium]|jgi:ribonuclease HI|nr:ribonuclease HI [Clostridiales bacterium]
MCKKEYGYGERKIESLKEVEIYTDGACSGNPGPGGWGAILSYMDTEKEISGCEASTTNNRMELTGIIKALEALNQPCYVKIYTDSAYVYNAFTQGWIETWQKNNWINSRKDPVENQDLWKALLRLIDSHQIEWNKVKGHSDNEKNNRCDALARSAIKQLKNESIE